MSNEGYIFQFGLHTLGLGAMPPVDDQKSVPQPFCVAVMCAKRKTNVVILIGIGCEASKWYALRGSTFLVKEDKAN